MSPSWTVTLHPDPPGIHTWGVWAGLAQLDHDGSIRLRTADLRPPPGPGLWIEIADHEASTRRSVYIDTGDGGPVWSPERAHAADAVWKRSPTEPTQRPLGLVSGVRSGHERRFAYAAAAARTALGSRDPRRFVSVVRGLSRAHDQPPLSVFDPTDPGEPCVLFQTRAWDPRTGGDPDDRERVSNGRADLVRTLRAALGPWFQGGFTDEPAARSMFPDLISDLPHDRHGFMALLPRCAVGVSTVGLHGSNPWKLVEFMGFGRAVVSEPLRFAIPETLDGVAAWFTTPDECAAHCVRLLDDPASLGAAQAAARSYWDDYVRPDRLVLRRLCEEREG